MGSEERGGRFQRFDGKKKMGEEAALLRDGGGPILRMKRGGNGLRPAADWNQVNRSQELQTSGEGTSRQGLGAQRRPKGSQGLIQPQLWGKERGTYD